MTDVIKAYYRDDQRRGPDTEYPIFDIEVGDMKFLACLIIGRVDGDKPMASPSGCETIERMHEMAKREYTMHMVELDQRHVELVVTKKLPEVVKEAKAFPDHEHQVVFLCHEPNVFFPILSLLAIETRSTGIHAPAMGTA